jgi:Flp pilus assembly protein CpaB
MSSAPLRTRLAPTRSAVRRAVLRRRRLLSALFAAAAVLAGVRAVSPPPPATESVLTAARDLPSGTVLDSDDLVTRQLPDGAAPDGLASGDDVVGRTVAAPLRRGEPVTDVRLVGPSLLDGYPGLVAVPVRIPDAGAAALLEVGDRVDLLATDPTGTEPAFVVARGAQVIALPAADEGTTGIGAVSGRLIVVATIGTVAEDLAAQAVRGFLSLALSRDTGSR